MSGRNGQELLSTWVPVETASAFKAQARTSAGGTSAALRRLVTEATGKAPAAPRGAGRGEQVSVRFKASERAALAAAAELHGTSPAQWLRSLALVRLTDQPQWNPAEVEALREVFRELRAIGNNVNQIAHAANAAVQAGRPAADQGAAALAAANLVREEMRRVAAVIEGNLAYWGRGEAEDRASRPEAARQVDGEVRADEAPPRKRPRRRAVRFAGES